MTREEQEIYEYGKEILDMGISEFAGDHLYKFKHTERCIEVPWFACGLNKYKIASLLDVGFTFASHDYLRLLLDWKCNHDLAGTDIINPEKVRSRYPKEWWKDIRETKVFINDLSSRSIEGENRDAVSLISTIEHIGFDKPSVTILQSAFERSETMDNVIRVRDIQTEKKVLDNVASMLKDNGYCFVSVPAGKGGATLIKDSVNLYGCYWEYEKSSWKKIIEHDKFVCLEQRFFIENGENWEEVSDIDDLKDVTANMKNYAAGLAVAVLQKK